MPVATRAAMHRGTGGWLLLGLATVAVASPAWAQTNRTSEQDLAAEQPQVADGWQPPRHWLGVEVGGTAAAQAVWKLRVAGPVHLNLGVFAGPEFFNGSAGVRVHVVDRRSWGWGVGGGVGGMGLIGFAEPCPADNPECESHAPSVTWGFGWLMAHIDTDVGSAGRSRLGCEAGFWTGSRHEVEDSGRETDERFVTAMVGATPVFGL